MNTVSLETAVFGLYAVAALAFCLGFVAASVLRKRPVDDDQAAPATDVRITNTGRPTRRPTEGTEPTLAAGWPPRRRGPRDWPTE